MISSTNTVFHKRGSMSMLDVGSCRKRTKVSYINFLYLRTILRSVIYETKSAWVTVVFFTFHSNCYFYLFSAFKAVKRGWKQITAEIVAAKRTFVSIWKIGAAQQQLRWTWSEIGSANNDDGDDVVVVDDDGDDGKARWEAEEGGLVRKTGTPSPPPLPNGCQQTTKFSSHDESRSQTKNSSQNTKFDANKRWTCHPCFNIRVLIQPCFGDPDNVDKVGSDDDDCGDYEYGDI